MKGRRGLKKKKGGISGVDRKQSVYVACVMRAYRRTYKDRGEGMDCGWRTRWLMSISYVQGGGARDCSQRLKSREPLLNLPGFRERGYIHRAKMPSLSSSKLCTLNASDLPLKGVSF